MTGTSRRELGVKTYREVMQAEPSTRQSVFVCNGRLDQEFAELWNRGVLTRKERRWLTLTALAGQGALNELRKHLHGALKSGDLMLDELMEGVYHFALYRGFGRAQEFEAQASQMNVATQKGHNAIVAKREGNEALARLRG